MRITLPPQIPKPKQCPQNTILPELAFPKLFQKKGTAKTQGTNNILYNPNNQNLNLYNQKIQDNQQKLHYQQQIKRNKDLNENQNHIYENINAAFAESNEDLPIQSAPNLPKQPENNQHIQKLSGSFHNNDHLHPVHLYQTAKFNSFQTVSFRGSQLKTDFNQENQINQVINNNNIIENKRIDRKNSIGQIRSPKNNVSKYLIQSPSTQNTSRMQSQQSPQILSPRGSQLMFDIQSPRYFSPSVNTIPQQMLAPKNIHNFYNQNQAQPQQSYAQSRVILTNNNFYNPQTNQKIIYQTPQSRLIQPKLNINHRFQQNMQNYVEYHESRLKQIGEHSRQQIQQQPTNQKPSIQPQKLKNSRSNTPIQLRGRSRTKSGASRSKKQRSLTENQPNISNISSNQSRMIENQQCLRQKLELQDKFRYLMQQFDKYRLQQQNQLNKLRKQIQSYQHRQRALQDQVYFLQRQREDRDRKLQQLSFLVKYLDQQLRMRSR